VCCSVCWCSGDAGGGGVATLTCSICHNVCCPVVCCSALQFVAVRSSVCQDLLQRLHSSGVLQCVSVCLSVLQCVAV